MASTPDMAPNRTSTTRRVSDGPRRTAAARAAAAKAVDNRDEELAGQIRQLQSDLKAIGTTLASLAGDKVNEAQSMAKSLARNLARSGQNAVEDVQDEFGQLERQLKDTIRDKPLTAVVGAAALGFILAVMTR